jgi:ABC-2 type transport system permease protein
MKKIFAIAWKDAIVRFGSSSELLFFIVLPVVFTFLLAGGTPSGEEDPRIPLVVVDEAKTVISRQVIAELENSTAVRPELTTREKAQSQFDDRQAEVVLILPAGIDVAHCRTGQQKWSCSNSPTT